MPGASDSRSSTIARTFHSSSSTNRTPYRDRHAPRIHSARCSSPQPSSRRESRPCAGSFPLPGSLRDLRRPHPRRDAPRARDDDREGDATDRGTRQRGLRELEPTRALGDDEGRHTRRRSRTSSATTGSPSASRHRKEGAEEGSRRKYFMQLMQNHAMATSAMKCKQTTDVANVTAFRDGARWDSPARTSPRRTWSTSGSTRRTPMTATTAASTVTTAASTVTTAAMHRHDGGDHSHDEKGKGGDADKKTRDKR